MVAELWRADNLSTQEIADRYGVSRVAVWKCLRRAGVDTAKSATRRVAYCAVCGVAVTRTRRYARRVRTTCCSKECYAVWLELGGRHGNGQKVARMRVRAHYGQLPEGAVVHHRDGDNMHNAPYNLMLFASNSEHVQWHRGVLATPLWMGE